MHLVVVHPWLEARGRPFPRSPWSRSRPNLRVLRPLTRGSQGQPSPLRTPHGHPGVQGIFPTSRGQVPHDFPWFTTPWRLVTQFHGGVAWRFRPPCPPHVPFPFASSWHRPVPSVPWTRYPVGPLCGSSHMPFPAPSPCPFIPCVHPCGAGPLEPLPSGNRFVRLARVAPFLPPSLSPVPRPRPISLGCRAAPSHPSSRVYTPPGCQQPCGAGPLDPHPSGDPFVRLARVAPFPPPSPVPRPRPNPLGCCAAPSHPSSRVYTTPGRQQPCGAGPLDPHPSGDRFVRLAWVAPLPPPPVTPVPPPMLSYSPGAVAWL